MSVCPCVNGNTHTYPDVFASETIPFRERVGASFDSLILIHTNSCFLKHLKSCRRTTSRPSPSRSYGARGKCPSTLARSPTRKSARAVERCLPSWTLFDLGMTAKTRPVLVVSVEYGDLDRAIVTVVPHTTEIRQSPFEIPIRSSFLRPGAFLVQGVSTYPKAWAIRKLGVLQPLQLDQSGPFRIGRRRGPELCQIKLTAYDK